MLFLREALLRDGKGNPIPLEQFGPVVRIACAPVAANADQPVTWYIDSLSLLSEEGAP